MEITFEDGKFEENKAGEITTISYNDKDVYMNGCDIPKKTMVEAFKHSGDYMTATTQKAADIATEKFKEDKKLEKVIIDFPYGPTGSGSTTIAVDREKTFRVPASIDATITRPNINVKLKHSSLKAGGTFIKNLQQNMLDALHD